MHESDRPASTTAYAAVAGLNPQQNVSSTLWRPLIMLWVSGMGLRLTVLALAPLLPAIRSEFALSPTALAALAYLPVLLLGFATLVSSFLISRLGPRRTLAAGLVVAALASALRAASFSPVMLFAFTFVMAVGIAAAQPTLPTLVNAWLPESIGRGTATYVNGMVVGQTIAAATTFELAARVGGWRLGLALWSVPLLLISVFVGRRSAGERRTTYRTTPGVSAFNWREWRSGRGWRLGLLLACAAVTYFASNAFIPSYLQELDREELITACLVALNVVQLLVSVLIGMLPHLLVPRLTFRLAGALSIGGVGAFLTLPGSFAVVGAVMLGAAAGLMLVTCLALPPALSDPSAVHRLASVMFTIGYVTAFVWMLLGGAVWEYSGRPFTAFFPVVTVAVLAAVLARNLPVRLSDVPDARSHLELR